MKNSYSLVLLLTVLTAISSKINAKSKHLATGDQLPKIKQSGLDFIENKGQWDNPGRYKANLYDGVFYLTDDGFVYHFVNADEWKIKRKNSDGMDNNVNTSVIHHHAYKVTFEGCNKQVSYQKAEKRSNYHNYFTSSDRSRWQGNVGLYGKVVQKNTYDGIDVAVYSKDNNLKYDFIVAPGADVSQIKLLYEGVVPQLTKEGNLRIVTSVNEITEQAPYCYQLVNGIEKKVKSAYHLKDGMLSFSFPEGYDKSVPLTIDPEVVYATFSGEFLPAANGIHREADAHSTAYDQDGKLYAAVTVCGLGWPTTLGAFQPQNSSVNINNPDNYDDVGILVFNSNGSQLAYATYFGGEYNDAPTSMIVNDLNELYLAGVTNSESDFPLTAGCYDNTCAGGTGNSSVSGLDMFVAHFNSGGTGLIGSTFLGGSGSECYGSTAGYIDVIAILGAFSYNSLSSPIDLALDPQGNVWLISNTASTDFPVTANAQQPVYGGGVTDAVLCKLNPDCSQLLYSSYLGGSLTDLGLSIIFNNAGNLVVCGGTKSTNFQVTAGTLHATAPGGGFDGYAAIINPVNGSIIKSTYLGTAGIDQASKVQVDDDDNVYVVGNSTGSYPVTPGTFVMPNGYVFLHKLSPDLSQSLASTTIGGTFPGSRLAPAGFVLTECGELLFSASRSLTDVFMMPTTSNAIMANSTQFWFCTMPLDFSALTYASFFGTPTGMVRSSGTHRYDPSGIVYQSFSVPTQSFPTTPGSWMPTSLINNNIITSASLVDIVSFKISFSFSTDFVLDPSLNANDSGCAPYMVQFANTSSGANVYLWDFGDGSPVSNLAVPPPHTYTAPGSYTVLLYAANDTACATGDTAYMIITVVEVVQPDITVSDTLICSNLQAVDIGVQINNPNPNFEVLWTPPNGILSPSDQSTITVNPTLNNTYNVTVTDDRFGLCALSATGTVTVTLAPSMLHLYTQDTIVCNGDIIQVQASGNPLYTYSWSPATGTNDSAVLTPLITANNPVNYMLTASYPGCPDTVLFLDVDVQYYPEVELGPDKSFCAGSEVPLESVVSPFRNDYLYFWTPNMGNLSNPDGPNTYFIADTSITYTLTVQTPVGCSGKDSIHVTVFPSVEGAITPDTGYCPPNQLQLEASGGTIYDWTPAYGLSDTTIATPVASPETSTDYTVIISNQYGCRDTQKVSIRVFPNAVLNMPDTVTVYPGEQYLLEPGTNCHYFSWFPPSGISATDISNPLFDPEVRTRYFVTATTEHGCVVKDSIDVLVMETVIDMPNAFAPGGYNKLFKPSIRGMATLKQFSIFNRWGNKIYSSNDINNGWDGTFNGQAQPLGVYVYTIEGITDSGRIFNKKGNVTLIR